MKPEQPSSRSDSDAILGQECEALIVLKCHQFTGEPPYVGNAGVLLALRESLDELNRLRSERGLLTEARRLIGAAKPLADEGTPDWLPWCLDARAWCAKVDTAEQHERDLR